MFTVRFKSYGPDAYPLYCQFHGRLTSRKYSYILETMREMVVEYSSDVIADIFPQMRLDEVTKKHSWDEGRHFIEMRNNIIDSPDVIDLSIDCTYIKSFYYPNL